MADQAYRVLADTSIPRPVRVATTTEGVEIEEVTGQAYDAGDLLLDTDLTARDKERAENGELDHLLEPVSMSEYEQAQEFVVPVVIPEHEAERYIQHDAGKRIVERDQLIEMKAAGAEAARANLEAARESGEDQRPQITEQPSFQEVSAIHEDEPVLPQDGETVPEAVVEAQGIEQSPGLPVGPVLAKATGADPDEVDSATAKPAKRARPGTPSKQNQQQQANESK